MMNMQFLALLKPLIPKTPPPHGFFLQNGSGGTRGTAGWGVAKFTDPNPNFTSHWAAALYGPVLTQPWDPPVAGGGGPYQQYGGIISHRRSLPLATTSLLTT